MPDIAAGAAAGCAAAPALAYSSTVIDLPLLMMAMGAILPPFMAKIVISASLRSPLSSNWMLPLAPSWLMVASTGRYLAGSDESAFFMAAINRCVAS